MKVRMLRALGWTILVAIAVLLITTSVYLYGWKRIVIGFLGSLIFMILGAFGIYLIDYKKG